MSGTHDYTLPNSSLRVQARGAVCTRRTTGPVLCTCVRQFGGFGYKQKADGCIKRPLYIAGHLSVDVRPVHFDCLLILLEDHDRPQSPSVSIHAHKTRGCRDQLFIAFVPSLTCKEGILSGIIYFKRSELHTLHEDRHLQFRSYTDTRIALRRP
ncbi:hypothetical protein E2C01_058965 [Portunus trituberculatus]|uniref:Uncharacterized protein n=1 Tax=Portunus trituberculatus TaxID=210409 RepID=A0A5B7H190_PORTR|nr:hypothetical protein [Portunus trituberculatus]